MSCARNFRLRGLVAIILILLGGWNAAHAAEPDWTVMVYMNGKNNLEPDALENFDDMASVGSTDRIKIVTELGRPTVDHSHDHGDWGGTLRFFVTKNEKPEPKNATVDLRSDAMLSDMGDPRALSDFLVWSIKNYPAKHYMVVIWNHGQGYRFEMASTFNDTIGAQTSVGATTSTPPRTTVPPPGGYRAVSYDEDTRHFLYNSDVQAAVHSAFGSTSVDILGFDACLMAMIETGYAFRNDAKLLVASEELEPGAGWDYAALLKALTRKPETNAADLARGIVATYEARYGVDRPTTLSAIDLTRISHVADGVSSFADQVLADKASALLRKVRASLRSFGRGTGVRSYVDLASLVGRFASAAPHGSAKTAALNLLAALKQALVTSYAGNPSIENNGATGLAIYFPATMADFEADPYHLSYLVGNTDHAVAFVDAERWATFLQRFLAQ